MCLENNCVHVWCSIYMFFFMFLLLTLTHTYVWKETINESKWNVIGPPGPPGPPGPASPSRQHHFYDEPSYGAGAGMPSSNTKIVPGAVTFQNTEAMTKVIWWQTCVCVYGIDYMTKYDCNKNHSKCTYFI